MAFVWRAGLFGLSVAFVVSSISAKTCWQSYNTFHPSAANSWTDKEPLPWICPNGEQTLTAKCSDSKGEPFTGRRNSTSNHYVATCTPKVGLVCNPYPGPRYKCPDFIVQFECECVTKGDKSMRSGSDVMKKQFLPIALLLQAISTVLLLS